MLFRDKFLGTPGRPLGEDPSNWIARLTEGGVRVSLDMLKAEMKLQKAGFEHVAQTHATASAALQGEFSYQIDRLSRQIAQSSRDNVEAQEQIVHAIQQMSDYLGAGLSEVRWAVERHTSISEEQLRVLLDSLGNESRQDFLQGVKCYDVKEDGIAKECFTDALRKNKTNFFAYQYLGFIAVHEDNENEAIRNFDLARKFAEVNENNYHHALALSHLARSHHATDELEKAADLSKQATERYPQLAKFWYELGGYSARLGRDEEAVKALKEAIEHDWTFFTIVVGDHDYDAIRPDVNRLLDSLREQERVKTRDSLDNLRRAISTAQKCGADHEIESWKQSLNELETMYQHGNVFVYREIVPKAEGIRVSAFQSAANVSTKQIAEKEAEVKRNELDKDSQLYRLRSQVDNLESKSRAVDSRAKFTDLGGYFTAYIILAIGTFVVVGILMLNNKVGGDIATWVCLCPIVIIVAIQLLVFIFGTAIPKAIYETRKDAEERRVNPLRRDVEKSYMSNKVRLEQELSALRNNLERCKQEQSF
jgi:tetratricopeptide (TPR) repeat protein